MLNSRIVLSVFLSSSATMAFATNGSLILQNSSWPEIPSEVHIQENKEVKIKNENGTFKYKINGDPNLEYFFQIKIQDGKCSLDTANSDLTAGNKGEWIYKVDKIDSRIVGNEAICDITIESAYNDNPATTQLKLEQVQFLNAGYEACAVGVQVAGTIVDMKPFTHFDSISRTEQNYLAVLTANTVCNKNGVHIYKWINGKYELVQKINGFVRPTALEFFLNDKDENAYLVIADAKDSESISKSGDLTIWRKTSLDDCTMGNANSCFKQAPGQPIAVDGVTDLMYFEQSGSVEPGYVKDGYLIAVRGGNALTGYGIESYVYSINKSSSTIEGIKTKIPTVGAQNVKHFSVMTAPASESPEGVVTPATYADFIAFANMHNSRSYNIKSNVLQYNGAGAFSNPQSVETLGAKEWEHININNKDYLVVANSYGDEFRSEEALTRVYVWENFGFANNLGDEIESAKGINDWKQVKIGQEHYFFAAIPNYKPLELKNANDATVWGAIYLWCENETQTQKCKSLDPDAKLGSLLDYTSKVTMPNLLASKDLNTSAWESVTINGETFILRANSLRKPDPNNVSVPAGMAGVQVIKASEE